MEFIIKLNFLILQIILFRASTQIIKSFTLRLSEGFSDMEKHLATRQMNFSPEKKAIIICIVVDTLSLSPL